MFENTNKDFPIEIAKGTMKAHRLRNIMTCLAVVLTTVLITIVCGAGISTMDAVMTESGMNPGPGTDGIGLYGNLQTLKKVREQPGVEWADIARPCMQGTPKNQEFAGNTIKFVAVNKGYYGHHYVELLSGRYPENEHEILMSDTLAEKTGRDMVPGQKITLNLMILKNGRMEQEAFEMEISGFFDSPFERRKDYEEIYTAENFPDVYNPELKDISSIIYVKLEGVTAFSPVDEIEEKIASLNQAVQGKGIILNVEMEAEDEITAAVVLLLLVMLCGFLLIYNIFRISVINDIHFIGNMKIIGMTKKQISIIFGWQIRRLAAIGIIIGVILGEGLNFFIIHFFQTLDFSYSKYYEAGNAMIPVIVFAVAFSVITVWVSSRTAVSLAKRISPTEASRFHSPGKKKRIFAMFSFALGGTLCCAIFTVFTGYDTEWMVKRENESDFVVEQWHSKQLMDEPYEPMTEEFVQGIRNLDFVKESYLFYRARSARCDKMKQNGIFGESMGEVKMEGHYKEIMKKEFQELGLEKEDWDFFVEEGRAETGIVGMEPDALDMEMENVDILDGKADVRLFASGDYLIYQPFAIPPDRKKKDYLKYGMKAGDKVTVSFWNSDLWEYQTRTFTIMAVVTKKNDNYAGTMCDGGVQFIMPDRVFKDVYKDSAKKMISALRMNTSGRKPEMEQKTIDQMIKENFNFQIQSGSRYKTRQEEEKKRVQELYIGILFGCIVAMIGIVNIINTLVTDVVSRKLEFSTMQSIGMTKRQMAAKICLDGMRMVLAGCIPVCFLAFFAARLLASLIFVRYVSSMYVVSCILILVTGFMVVGITSCALTGSLNKKTVAERLREAE